MNFFKYPFFNKSYDVATTINKKFFKNISVLTLVLLSVCFSLVYIAFIFFIGLDKFIPKIFIENPDIRNLFICIIHTFAGLFAILYASLFIDRSKYDGKIISPAITTVIVFTLNLFLAWRCYFKNELDILVYIMTADGTMLSVFLLFLSIFQYDILSKKTARRYMPASVSRVLIVVAMVLFLVAIFAYYNYLSSIISALFSAGLTAFQTDALVLFMFMIACLCQITAIILMYSIERKINVMLKEFTERVRSKNK